VRHEVHHYADGLVTVDKVVWPVLHHLQHLQQIDVPVGFEGQHLRVLGRFPRSQAKQCLGRKIVSNPEVQQ
jgi:hypothetical protein